jgi:PAS domain S-box-containing protein
MTNNPRSPKDESTRPSSTGTQSKSSQLPNISEALAKTTTRFSQLYNHLPLSCVILDPVGKIIFLNDWAISHLGYSPEELRDRKIFSISDWPEFPTEQKFLSGLSSQHRESNAAYRVKITSKSRQEFWFKAMIHPVPIPDESSANICLICQDITEEHLAQESQAALTDELMQMSDRIVIWVDRQGNILRCNDYLTEVSGYPRSELIGESLSETIFSTNVSGYHQVQHELQDFLWDSSDSMFRVVEPIIGKNQISQPVAWKITKNQPSQSQGISYIWLGTIQETSETENLPNNPEIMGQNIRQILPTGFLYNLPEVVALFDENLCYVYLNSAMESVLGLSADEVLGKTNQDLGMPRDWAEAWNRQLKTVLTTGESIEEEFILPISSQESVNNMDERRSQHQWYQFYWLPIFGCGESVNSVVSIGQKKHDCVAMASQDQKTAIEPTSNELPNELPKESSQENIYSSGSPLVKAGGGRSEPNINQLTKLSNQIINNFNKNKNPLSLQDFEHQLISSLQILNEKMQQEIQDRKLIEKVLKYQQERLQLIINTNADGIIVVDKFGYIKFVNPAAAVIFGRHKKNLLGQDLGQPILKNSPIELEIIRPNGSVAVAQMQVVEIPWIESKQSDALSDQFLLESAELAQGLSAQDCQKTTAYLGSIRDVTDQKLAWERLSWMKQAIESASDAIAITDYSGKVVYQNPAFCQLFEYLTVEDLNQIQGSKEAPKKSAKTSENELGRPLLEQSPLISLLFTNANLGTEVLDRVRNGGSWQGEVSMQSQSGKVMQILLQADAITDELGGINGLICTYTDITERRQAEERLRKSFAQNQAIVNTIPDALFHLNAEGVYLDCHIGDQFKFCQHPRKLIGTHCRDLLPSFLAEEQTKAIAQALKTKKVQVFEFQLVLPNAKGQNRLYDYEARVAAIGDDEVLIMVRDVSGQAEVQRSLQESEERYRTLAEASHDLIFIFNRDTSIQYVNLFAADKFGRSPNELVGQSLEDLFPDDIARKLKTTVYEVLRDKKPSTLEQKLDVQTAPTWLHISLVPLANQTGIITSVLGVARDITERIEAEAALKQSQEKLRQSEQKLLRIFATAPIGITTCDLSGHFKILNDGLCGMLGYLAVELRKLSFRDLLHARDQEEFQSWISALPTQKIGQAEKEQYLICKDGREIIAMIRIALIRDQAGNPQQIVATVEDITDRKRAQEQLLLLGKAVESASDAIAITDCHGRSTYHNPAFEELFQFSAAELAAIGGPQILYRDADIALEVFDAIFRDGSWQGEVEMVSAQGTTRQIFLRTDAIYDASTDKIIALLGVYRDITERKQAIDALAESEARFRMLADTAPVLIWRADIDGNYTFFNQTWLQFTGRSFEEEQDYGWMSQIHPDDFQDCLRKYLQAVETLEPFRLLYRLRHADGEYRWLLNTGVPLPTPAGNFAGYIGSCLDISDRKQLEEQLNERAKELEQSNAELEQFAYIASHDLQEPLRTISSYTQLLAKRYQGQLDAKADKYINYVVDGAQRMQTLIEDLLKYSRVSTRRQEFKPVNCQEMLERAIANLKVAIRKADAQVCLAPDCESLPVVRGDETQLLQLFQKI